MSLSTYITQPRKALAITQPSEHIFFLSHMRAYSSLFGHIMGSHPQISGYYELHIGYHSWKSLIRQKMLFFQEEEPKPKCRYMFDKVLHNDHHVAPHLLNTDKTKAIFSLRDPVKTIPSIMALYAKEDPTHEFNDAEFSTHYYIDRAEELVSLASKMDREYFYFDAEVMTQQTDECLGRLSQWLNLSSPLSSSYSVQKKTSMSRYGDTSETLKSGKIELNKSKSTPFQLTPDLSQAATEAYMRCREALANSTSASCLNITSFMV
ncbi:MAG: hypothetical protein AB8B48_12560 [Pseudomonadales bacterium]